MNLPRSLPAGFSTPQTPPVHTTDSTTMTKSKPTGGFLSFLRTTLFPILIALILYLFIFHFLLPLYRKHRARYANYLPISTIRNTSSRIPSLYTIRTTLSHYLPTSISTRLHIAPTHSRRASIGSSASDNILTDESGEAMVGFDYSNNTGSIEDQNRRRRDAMERQVARGLAAAREMNMGAEDVDTLSRSQAQTHTQQRNYPLPPERRLSRELEEVFRDDSDDSDDEDGPNGVTAGRRMSVNVSR
jgi:hypothetical protein